MAVHITRCNGGELATRRQTAGECPIEAGLPLLCYNLTLNHRHSKCNTAASTHAWNKARFNYVPGEEANAAAARTPVPILPVDST